MGSLLQSAFLHILFTPGFCCSYLCVHIVDCVCVAVCPFYNVVAQFLLLSLGFFTNSKFKMKLFKITYLKFATSFRSKIGLQSPGFEPGSRTFVT